MPASSAASRMPSLSLILMAQGRSKLMDWSSPSKRVTSAGISSKACNPWPNMSNSRNATRHMANLFFNYFHSLVNQLPFKIFLTLVLSWLKREIAMLLIKGTNFK